MSGDDARTELVHAHLEGDPRSGTPSIRSLATVVPPTVLHQSELRDLLAGQPGTSRLGVRRIKAVFDAAAIETRHTVLAELGDGGASPGGLFLDSSTGRLQVPGTGARNDLYRRAAKRLYVLSASGVVRPGPTSGSLDWSRTLI